MKQSVGKIFLKRFMQSFLIVSVLLVAGILTYKITMNNWQETAKEDVQEDQEETIQESITQASVDDISKNLIYCYNQETNEITKLVLEIFNSKEKKLTYITIPMRTQLSMSYTLYHKMIAVHPEMPQLLQLSVITKYLNEATVFDYGVLMIEDLLNLKISYYTVIPQETYDTIFVSKMLEDSKESGSTLNTPSVASTLPVEVFTNEYKELLTTIKSTGELRNYIENLYQSVQSNLALPDKLSYVESYSNSTLSDVTYELIEGKNKNSAYLIDSDLAAQQLDKLMQEHMAGKIN